MNKPIGCRVVHFNKKVGKNWVCMYCGDYAFVHIKLPNGCTVTFKPLFHD